jgi:hypothetical protein
MPADFTTLPHFSIVLGDELAKVGGREREHVASSPETRFGLQRHGSGSRNVGVDSCLRTPASEDEAQTDKN